MVESARGVKAPVKVCMHLLGTARTDYRVMRDATTLVQAGYVVSIIDVESTRTRPAEEVVQGVCMKHIFMPGWFIHARFKPWFLVKLALLIVCGIIRLLRIEADIYHAHVEIALPACFIAARLRRKPLIFDSPELPMAEPNVTYWRRLSACSAFLLGVMVRRCAGVVAVSAPIIEEMRNRYQISEVTLIRNVPIYRKIPKSGRLRQYLGLGTDARIALYQGNLQPGRGLDKLVHVAQFLTSNTVVVMMGKGYGTTQAELETLIAAKRVADRVKIIPPVPYEDLLDWTASADIGLIVYAPDYSLNIRMILPNKFFEFLMAGLPVLASSLPAVEEVIKTYDVGRVLSSLDPAAVAAEIEAMLIDRARLDLMRRNALDAAQDEFKWEKERHQLLHLYETILENKNE